MSNSTSPRLRTDCQAALGDDNLELCLKMLMENLPSHDTVLQFLARLNVQNRDKRMGVLSRPEYILERNILRLDVLQFVGEELSTLETKPKIEGIAERILVVECDKSPTDWRRIFPDHLFLNREFMTRGGKAPAGFESPDVLVFDNLNCGSILGPKSELKQLAKDMPLAHILYVGDQKTNPFMDSPLKDDQAIFARTGNANSHLSIHGRLNELLEFRKNYGPPLSTVILENMKDKLPLKVFISYSHADEDWKRELDMHLASMKRQGLIEVWQDRQIAPGSEWDAEIKHRLESSHLVLLMLSAGFINSEYINRVEVPMVMGLLHAGKAKVVPIYAKFIDTTGEPYEKLQGLPRDKKFLASQTDRDQILVAVAKELRELVENWGK